MAVEIKALGGYIDGSMALNSTTGNAYYAGYPAIMGTTGAKIANSSTSGDTAKYLGVMKNDYTVDEAGSDKPALLRGPNKLRLYAELASEADLPYDSTKTYVVGQVLVINYVTGKFTNDTGTYSGQESIFLIEAVGATNAVGLTVAQRY